MKGIIKFDSEPENIDVYLNGEHMGVTPLDVVDVNPGIYSYSMKKDEEHQFSSELQIKQRKITHIMADFTTNSINKEYIEITDEESPFPTTVSRSKPDSPMKQTESSSKEQHISTESSSKEQSISSEEQQSPMEEQQSPMEEQQSPMEEQQLATEKKLKQANTEERLTTIDKPRKTKEKSIFYNTGHVSIATATTAPPDSNDEYPSVQDVYINNNQNPIEIMTLMNHGPGNLFYILRDKSQNFTTTEETLHVGESRILYNVYEIRLRTDIPDTQYHLVEGELKSGNFSRNYKNYIENRIVLQPNEFDCTFEILFDNNILVVPGTALPTNNALYIRQNPLAAGTSTVLINSGIFSGGASTNIFPVAPNPMPFLIPTGYIAEGFSFLGMMTTSFTIRDWIEIIPGSGTYTLLQTFPFPARSSTFATHNLNVFSTIALDPTGAPAPGRNFIFTITNDDVANAMIGWAVFEIVLRKMS